MSSRHVARWTNTAELRSQTSRQPLAYLLGILEGVSPPTWQTKGSARQTHRTPAPLKHNLFAAQTSESRPLSESVRFLSSWTRKKVPGIVSTSTRGTSFCSPGQHAPARFPADCVCLMMGLGAEFSGRDNKEMKFREGANWLFSDSYRRSRAPATFLQGNYININLPSGTILF